MISSLVDDELVGYVQATVVDGEHGRVAELAWVVGTPWQGRGYAKEAAQALSGWLRTQGVGTVIAHIHPAHAASARVAASTGLTRTDHQQDGEIRWQLGLLS